MLGFKSWLLLAAVLIFVGIAVPYGILGGAAASPAIFYFWCLFGLAIILVIALGVARWRV